MGPARGPEAGRGSERVSVFLKAEQIAALRAIHAETGIPVAELIRQGVDWILTQHGKAPARAVRRAIRRARR